jgi:hypothetical protein
MVHDCTLAAEQTRLLDEVQRVVKLGRELRQRAPANLPSLQAQADGFRTALQQLLLDIALFYQQRDGGTLEDAMQYVRDVAGPMAFQVDLGRPDTA